MTVPVSVARSFARIAPLALVGWMYVTTSFAQTSEAPATPAPADAAEPVPASAPKPAPATPAATPAAPEPSAAATRRPEPRRELTWDLNLEGGLGHSLADGGGFSGFGRVRGGLLLIDASQVGAPRFYSLGVFTDLSNLDPEARAVRDGMIVTYGVQGEVLDLNSGLWAQLGIGVDTAPRPVFVGSVGWSLFGFEAQGRFDPEAGAYAALFGKLRVPIGIIAAATR